MRPKFVFIILVCVECFLLVMLMSPGASQPKSLLAAQGEYQRTHSPEAKQIFEDQRTHVRHRQYLLFISAVAVIIIMIVYGWYRKL
jgi:predicted nucleic acid-binding Zn ribbon protein